MTLNEHHVSPSSELHAMCTAISQSNGQRALHVTVAGTSHPVVLRRVGDGEPLRWSLVLPHRIRPAGAAHAMPMLEVGLHVQEREGLGAAVAGTVGIQVIGRMTANQVLLVASRMQPTDPGGARATTAEFDSAADNGMGYN